ncbi:MAG: fatty acid desaturase [Alphaproteobacteria bacterium]|nr:fatty acid desaturase [Alphaproteobacteria bacterium]
MAYPATLHEIEETADTAPVSPRRLLTMETLQAFERRSNVAGALRLAAHGLCMTGTGVVVWLATPSWLLLIPAMVLHGATLVAMFAPMHECTHRTAFVSRRANDVVGWLAGLLCVYNSNFYRYYHGWHHRYTQDPARDPELMYPRATDRLHYLLETSGYTFWSRRLIDYPAIALGRTAGVPFVPASARHRIALSMSAQLLIYVLGAGTVVLGSTAFLYYWLLPVLLATPLLRSYLIAEHTDCSRDRNRLTNTRTTLTIWPIRLLMWNMPFHAEHHLYPTVPFHRLPQLHTEIGRHLAHIGPGYVAVNRAVLGSRPFRRVSPLPR